jgi:CDP-glycerol glycerophosphotransferase (TagB/SpsB family)
LVVIGAANGRRWADNGRSLYEWLLAHRPDLNTIWLTGERSVFQMLRRRGNPVALSASWPGLMALSRASVGAYTHSLTDLAPSPFLVPEDLPLLSLRHGKSVKKVRFAQSEPSFTRRQLAERRYETARVRYAISTSAYISQIQAETLQIPENRNLITGYPRNDALLLPPPELKAQWETFLGRARPRAVALYAPTWRHGREATRFFPFGDFDPLALVDYLRSRSLLLLLRPHPNDASAYPEMMTPLRHLAESQDVVRLLADTDLPDVHSALPFTDVLVTDYSSLYHDFLLLDRPMVFVPYDYEEFSRRNGFHYDYLGDLPGPAVGSMAQLIAEFESVLEGRDASRLPRARLADRIHKYRDARSCERVAAVIDQILSGEPAG